jgi:hypothetical protein
MNMSEIHRHHGYRADRSALAGILLRLCPRCRRGSIFAALWVMHDDCPVYVSYGMAIPLIALLTLIEYWIIPGWSLFRLVVLAALICVPLIPWIWQYSRVIWIYFDRYFDPEDEPRSGGEAEAPTPSPETDAGSEGPGRSTP